MVKINSKAVSLTFVDQLYIYKNPKALTEEKICYQGNILFELFNYCLVRVQVNI